jgi:hypothetical protein
LTPAGVQPSGAGADAGCMSAPGVAAARPATAVAWTPAAEAEPPVAVEAGTLLAVAPPGAVAAGEGVVEGVRSGAVELRAARDGTPRRRGEVLVVDAIEVIEGPVDRASGDRDVRGALRVEGSVAPGRRIATTAGLAVAGMVDRAVLQAGGPLVVDGRAAGAVLEAGDVTRMRRLLRDALGGAPDELAAVARLAAQLVAAAAERGAAVAAARVVETLGARRFPGLAERLAHAEAVLATARRSRPGLAPALALELASARATLADPARADDPVGRLDATAAFLAAALATPPAAAPAGIRLGAAHRSRIACPGTLRLTGTGAVDCEIDVGGDLLAVAPGGGLRGGVVSVGGRLRAGELSGRRPAPLRIDLGARPAPGALLAADVAEAGVEIAAAGQVIRIDRRRYDLRVALEAGRLAVR